MQVGTASVLAARSAMLMATADLPQEVDRLGRGHVGVLPGGGVDGGAGCAEGTVVAQHLLELILGEIGEVVPLDACA